MSFNEEKPPERTVKHVHGGDNLITLLQGCAILGTSRERTDAGFQSTDSSSAVTTQPLLLESPPC